jgi:hypothetical protein
VQYTRSSFEFRPASSCHACLNWFPTLRMSRFSVAERYVTLPWDHTTLPTPKFGRIVTHLCQGLQSVSSPVTDNSIEEYIKLFFRLKWPLLCYYPSYIPWIMSVLVLRMSAAERIKLLVQNQDETVCIPMFVLKLTTNVSHLHQIRMPINSLQGYRRCFGSYLQRRGSRIIASSRPRREASVTTLKQACFFSQFSPPG